MDLLLILKFLHVTCAIVWLGGGLAVVLLGVLLGPRPDPQRLLAVVGHLTVFAPRVLVPFSVATLISGVLLVWLGGYGWPAWVVLGLLGIAFTSGFGALVLGPLAGRAVAAGGQAGAAMALRLLRLAKFDYVVQFAIVYLMVAKPYWSDVLPLAAVGGAIALGAALLLRPQPQAA